MGGRFRKRRKQKNSKLNKNGAYAPKTLTKMIKKTTGFNFKELLQRKRLSKAVELMCDTDLPISDIIAAVGYENNSYFHRVFKERYGVTPRAFRVANKKNDKVRL